MPRRKKDGRFINYYIDRTIYERLEQYAQDKSQPVTMALERILDEHLTRYEDEMALVDRYCPKCHVLVRNTRCPLCGRRWLEEPESEDYCFLTEKELVWAGVLEDCFRQNQILYLTESTLGAGLTAKAGSMFESIKFYVRYDDFHRAEALTEELFSSDVQEDAGADPVV